MGSWTVYNFECADVAGRDALLERIAAHHPVTFPPDDDSVFADVDTGSSVVGADYAWVDRYLYVTVMGTADVLFEQTVDLWDRAAKAKFDGTTETATDVTFVADTEPGGDDEVEASQFHGLEGFAGLDVMYGLAMLFEFRFRSYADASPTTQLTPHPSAFDAASDVVGHLDEFTDDMAERTGVDTTREGRAFLRKDPALERHRATRAAANPGEGAIGDAASDTDTDTTDCSVADVDSVALGDHGHDGEVGADGDTDADSDSGADGSARGGADGGSDREGEPGDVGVDAIHVVDGSTGEVATFERAEDVPDDPDDEDAGLMERFRQLLGGG